MKAKFLDLRNCHCLLPSVDGLSTFARLDECLQGINSQPGALAGVIDTLIRQNQSTSNAPAASRRLIACPVDVAQSANIEQRVVQTQAMTKPPASPALYHAFLGFKNGMAHKLVVPLQYLLKGWGDASKGYQGYVHSISENVPSSASPEELHRLNSRDSDTYYYVGITGRHWLLRLDEHAKEMANGSQRLFYRTWREHFGASGILFTSALKKINLTFEEAMNWEEAEVDKIASDQFGLNMIPGGFKGIRLLHQHRIIDNAATSLEARDEAIAEYCRLNPRKGLPNPFIEALWKSDDFYLKVMEAKEKTLSAEQVRKIRSLHAQGRSAQEILDTVDALNVRQVKNVTIGKTYRRIPS